MDDEHDVQYLLGALLDVQFDDIEPEDWTPSYAGGASRIDFVLRQERIAIETKRTRPSLGAKEVGEELLVDIARYETHSGVDTLICLSTILTDTSTTPAALRATSRKRPPKN